jgi:hypothetical protein
MVKTWFVKTLCSKLKLMLSRLLFDALYYMFILCMAMKTYKARTQILNQPLVHGGFDSKLIEFLS